jgi:hypothetical protein
MSELETVETHGHPYEVDYTDTVSVPADTLRLVLNELFVAAPNRNNVREPLGRLLEALLDHACEDWEQHAALELSNSTREQGNGQEAA